MTMKRSSSSIVVKDTKRHKQNYLSLIDTFMEESSNNCSGCRSQDETDCINSDLLPKIYFSLALVLEDSSCQFLLSSDKDYTVLQLNEYAYKLSLDTQQAISTLSKLVHLSINFTTELIQELMSLLSQKKLHEKRELKFIGQCLTNLSTSTMDMIQSQIKSEKADLQFIAFEDIRMARLLPLLSMIYDDSSPVDLTRSDEDVSFLSNLSLRQNSDMEVFELDEEGNIIDSQIQQESQDPFILPAPSEITVLEEEAVGDNQTQRFPSPDMSLSFPNSQDISVPDYDIYTTAELKAKLKQYGFKTSNNRGAMIQYLQKIYSSIHSNSQTSSVASQKRAIDTPPVASPSSQSTNDDTRIKIINHIKSSPDLMNKILNYESISVDECNVGLNCKKSAVKSVLDEIGASSQILNKKFKATN